LKRSQEGFGNFRSQRGPDSKGGARWVEPKRAGSAGLRRQRQWFIG
jgi:hypothetical protein